MTLSLTGKIAQLLSGTSPALTAESFGALYDRTHLLVFRYIYGLHGGPQEEVEDLTAETFLRAWRGRGSFTGNGDAAVGWLLQIARHLVIDAFRRRKARPDNVEPGPEDVEAIVAPDAGPEERSAAREQWDQLWELLQQLPPDHREMLVLRYLLGWRVNRIARHFALAENTVSATLRRLLLRLRRDWPQPDAFGG